MAIEPLVIALAIASLLIIFSFGSDEVLLHSEDECCHLTTEAGVDVCDVMGGMENGEACCMQHAPRNINVVKVT